MKKNIFKLSIFAVICGFLVGNASFATTDIYTPETNPAFKFSIYAPSEYLTGNINGEAISETSNLILNPDYYESLKQAGYYWNTMLKRPVSATTPALISVLIQNVDGASAGSSNIFLGDPVRKTLLNALYNGLDVSSAYPENSVTAMVIGTGVQGRPYSINEFNVLPLNSEPDLNVVVAHEMGHALGILTQTTTDSGGAIRFSDLSDWSQWLRVDDINGNTVASVSGRAIEVNNPSSLDSNVFNIAVDDNQKNAPYFAGLNTLGVLKGDRMDDVTFKHYQDDYSGVRVKGLPINGIESDDSGILKPELSHIELRNSYMSHQNYRNWSTFMEAELAVMKDLGYEVDLREHYGKSYYTDNNGDIILPVTNSIGFGTPDGSGGYIADSYNNTPFGIGLHIYGDGNHITQTGKILSDTDGLASVGARIEGVNNDLTIDTKVDMQGKNSVGLLTSYGKGHNITINNDAIVSATGENGIGASFNFGKNVLGEHLEHRGSYITSRCIAPIEEIYDVDVVNDIKGALVDTFTVNGTLQGEKAAIYIDDTAYVKQIDINSSAEIKGDIISNWNSKTSGLYSKVQLDGVSESELTDGLLMTKLNFNNYGHEIKDKINGETFVMNVKDDLTVQNEVNVYSLTNNTGSNLNLQDGSKIYTNSNVIANAGAINIDGNVTLGSNIGAVGSTAGTLTIGVTSPATVTFTKDVDKIYNEVTIQNGSTLNFANGRANDIEVSGLTFNSNANMSIDVDIVNQSADRFKFDNSNDLEMNGNTLTIDKVNVAQNLEGAVIAQSNFDIPLVSEDLNNQNLNLNVTASMPNELTTAIFKYNMDYDIANNRFMMRAPFGGGSNNYKNFNPAVLAGPVAAQVGTYLTQISSYDQAFTNFDLMMALPKEQRQAMKYANRFASEEKILTYSPNQMPEQDKGLWFRPYAVFERVNLNNGPSVGNNTYGSYFGGDSGILDLGKDWNVVYAGYAGYNGSHQTYDGISIYQNGGQLGGSAFAYKNNFWSGVTLNVGINAGRAHNNLGHEDFTTLGTGIASKTGYNFEFNKGKFIVQPNFLISYSFVNMFDYTNSAGVRIKSDPLNAIQIAPGVKFIGNLGNGWQPYLGVQMIWNLIDKTHVSAANVSLPNTSIDPYVQYGVGLQKRCGDRFTGFAQAMFRNGGTNGIALSAGLRWAIGK